MQNAQLAYVANALSQLQKLFLFFLLSGVLIAAVAFNGGFDPAPLLGIYGLAALVGMVWMLVCTYRCASGTGRSGILWLFIVFLFKLFGLIAICWVTRRWLTAKGVKVSNLGMSFELPGEEVLEDTVGFSRF
ncbi:MAG: hypothetical protein KF760_33180 [Candidatus Eremiobacteraeota bacterium]|nr:hypothetical protein [Candidatus Eremiobacteraeota bacterium]MCW5872592.1 hypothetical protein [Candidatus Eremiobacteraeota bacterium]